MNILSIKKVFFISLFYSFFLSFCPLIAVSFNLPFTVISSINKNIFFLQDALQHNFVLKYHFRNPKRAIYDTLGAYIGKSIDINVNEVEIFSQQHVTEFFKELHLLELSPLGIITLHSYVPGTAVVTIKNMHEEICIKGGLCKIRHLKSITKYTNLCAIVAFDIFIDNPDRHNDNLYFDKNTDQFYAIDMDHSFKFYTLGNAVHDRQCETLATKAYNFLQTIAAQQLSSQEIKALALVQTTLQLLVNIFSPEKIFIKWMSIAQKADSIYSSVEQEKIIKYLTYHAYEINRLLQLLETICL